MRGVVLGVAGAALLVGCPKAVPVGEQGAQDVWLGESPVAPRLCVAALPQAGPLGVEDVALWRRALDQVAAGQAGEAWMLLRTTAEHPTFEAARAVLALLLGDPQSAYAQQSALVDHFPDDPCLLQTGAMLAYEAGEIAPGLALAEAAIAAAPQDDNAAYVRALLLAEVSSEDAERAADAIVARSPSHLGATVLQMMLRLERGALREALEPMHTLHDAGLPTLELLASAYRELGEGGEALRVYAEAKAPPFVAAPSIAAATDPMAAYRAWLGVGPGQDLVARIDTTAGVLTCTLFAEEAPLTVASFVGLARGTLPWTGPDGAPGSGPLYAGTTFHRVIPAFMVQGGDPSGDGTGGPGWTFPDEFSEALRFDRPGRLGMANSGPGTNGSQFFVAEVPLPYLDGRHTVFGQCDEASLAVVHDIARAPTGALDRPVEPVVIKAVEIEVATSVPR